MIKKIKLLFVSLAAASMVAMPLAVVGVVSAQDQTQVQQGLCNGTNLNANVNNPTCSTDTVEGSSKSASDKINDIVKLVINLFSILVGVVAVIMIIVGGLKYITSSGDSGNVTSAKNTILYAVIGLV